jgi:hypothetical protein
MAAVTSIVSRLLLFPAVGLPFFHRQQTGGCIYKTSAFDRFLSKFSPSNPIHLPVIRDLVAIYFCPVNHGIRTYVGVR